MKEMAQKLLAHIYFVLHAMTLSRHTKSIASKRYL
jgi:hypothetical protein